MASTRKNSTRSLMICGFIMAASAFAFLVLTIRNGSLGKQSASWPSTIGTIRNASIVESSKGGRTGRTSYTLDVQYDYAVSNVSYTGSRLGFARGSHNDKAIADRRAEELASSNTVPVFYNPAEPSMSVLQPGLPSSYWFFYLIGSSFLLLGLGMVGFAIRRRRNGRNTTQNV